MKKVAVIVPVYNVEKELISKCIDSLLNQTYHNVEIYIVNDGSNDETREFLQEVVKDNSTIKLLDYDKNEGLFSARIKGVMNSKSDYIAFVDADDYVTPDWIRELVENAEKNCSDIAMGHTISVDENGWRYVYPKTLTVVKQKPIDGNAIIDRLMLDEGLDFSWHTVWNKLYTRELWNKALFDLTKVNKHIVMTEDILFSVVLFYYAKKMSFCDADGYFYYRNAESSTKDTNTNRLKKDIDDIFCVFSFFKEFLEDKGILNKYIDNYTEWKNRYFRWWSPLVDKVNESVIREEFLAFFEKEVFEYPTEGDDIFLNVKETWNNTIEELKEELLCANYEVISFDIFDTLIQRTVLNPEDIFEIIDRELDSKCKIKGNFVKCRKAAEQKCRQKVRMYHPNYEDILLIINIHHHLNHFPFY